LRDGKEIKNGRNYRVRRDEEEVKLEGGEASGTMVVCNLKRKKKKKDYLIYCLGMFHFYAQVIGLGLRNKSTRKKILIGLKWCFYIC
jgi:hypothetical protein